MTRSAKWPGLLLRFWLIVTFVLSPFLRRHLKKRLRRGKEIPDRWREKLGTAGLARPKGQLVWMHAVGLGEVMALRGLILRLSTLDETLEFLVTSSTRASAEVFSRNMPARCRHQFLPLDSPRFASRFLEHWKPDLSIWSEQDLWPGMVWQADKRGIPLALVNGRMNRQSFQARRRLRPLYRDLYRRFSLISAQDGDSAAHLQKLGAAAPVSAGISLKPASPELDAPEGLLTEFRNNLSARRVWVAASTHIEDEEHVLAAHIQILKLDPTALLILIPRDIFRGPEIISACKEAGLKASLRTQGPSILPGNSIYVADTYGEMGLWYRLTDVAFIGGSFGAVQGHNPWEAAKLGLAVLHGPNTENFALDYQELGKAGATMSVSGAAQLATEIQSDTHAKRVEMGLDICREKMASIDELCQNLLELISNPDQNPHG